MSALKFNLEQVNSWNTCAWPFDLKCILYYFYRVITNSFLESKLTIETAYIDATEIIAVLGGSSTKDEQ